LAVANGGTGATTLAGLQAAALPTQAPADAGKFLTTDGAGNTSWAAAGSFPSGTTMPFYQAAAPTGWTQVTTAAINDSAIRLVTGATGGSTGGTISFSTFFSATSTYSGAITITSGQVGDTSLSTAQLASHTHVVNDIASNPGQFVNYNPIDTNVYGSSTRTSDATGSGAVHTHSLAGAAANGNFTSNFDVKYANFIVCSKN
jgi:hypothetical protein